MKFSGKLCCKIIFKVTKNQGFTLPLENTFLEKPQGCQVDPPSLFSVNALSPLIKSYTYLKEPVALS